MEINATILISAISFLVFIFIMNKILYQPVLDIMEKRKNYIESNKNQAQAHKRKAEDLISDKNSKIADAQRKSRDIVAAKSDALKEEKNKVLNDAKTNAAAFFNTEKQNLVHQKEETAANMKFDVADIANRLTTKLMGEGIAFEPLNEQEVEEVMKKND